MSKILIAGGTGFVGKQLISYLVEKGYPVNVLTRKSNKNETGIQYFKWDVEKCFIDSAAFEGVNAIINLTGANITEQRWTAKRRKEILVSRTKAIDLLFKYVSDSDLQIDKFISSSAVGFYGAVTSDRIFIEADESGKDFLASVCRQWERAALQFERLGVKTIILRKGVILGSDGGMYKKLGPLAKLGINTALGNGLQYLPWIDIRDLLRVYDFMLNNENAKGIFNAVATEHITMNAFAKTLLSSVGKKSILPNMPAFLIRLWLGERALMLLAGSRASNAKLKGAGFHFEFDSIKNSLASM